MTTAQQKNIELRYAEKAGELLGKSWQIEPSPDEENWPDLIVKTKTEKFGLEVREVYPDESIKKGSKKKASENKNLEQVKKIAADYYKKNQIPIKVNLLGNIRCLDKILDAITKETPKIPEFDSKRIEPYAGCSIYILRLPEDQRQYYEWKYISDRVGWVSDLSSESLNKVIRGKAKNLSKYRTNLLDVRLLLVSNKTFNSGKAHISKNITLDLCDFNSIYYLSFPDEIHEFRAGN